jgi:hypothetical protein
MWRNITKMAVKETVSLVVARKTRETIVDHTDVDPDSITLRVGSMVVGEVVAVKAKPYTDNAIDKVADWIESKRNKKEQPSAE